MKVKTHTTHISGTNAQIQMVITLTEKIGLNASKEIRSCEKLVLNMEERGNNQINIFDVADTGTCLNLIEEIGEDFWDSEQYELSVKIFNGGPFGWRTGNGSQL